VTLSTFLGHKKGPIDDTLLVIPTVFLHRGHEQSQTLDHSHPRTIRVGRVPPFHSSLRHRLFA